MKVASDSATIEISDETDSATGNKAEAVKLSINRPLGRGSCVAKHQLSADGQTEDVDKQDLKLASDSAPGDINDKTDSVIGKEASPVKPIKDKSLKRSRHDATYQPGGTKTVKKPFKHSGVCAVCHAYVPTRMAMVLHLEMHGFKTFDCEDPSAHNDNKVDLQ